VVRRIISEYQEEWESQQRPRYEPKVQHGSQYNFILHGNEINCTPLPWSSGQSSWLQIQRSGFDSRLYETSSEIMGLERGPLSLVSTTEELLGRKSSGLGPENRDYGHRDPSGWSRGTFYPQKKLALTSLTISGRSVGIVRSRTKATELFHTFLKRFAVKEIDTWHTIIYYNRHHSPGK
jgi:hypothetical protein